MWQDWVLAVGNWVFIAALIPAIISNQKPPRSTCLMTGVTLSAFVVSLATLKLIAGPISMGLSAVCWWILALQKRA